jgi:hypothetical protein
MKPFHSVLSGSRTEHILRGDVVYTKVSEFICAVTGYWDVGHLNDLFNTVDVNHILEISVNNNGFDNFIAWSYTNYGRYAVKLGYHVQ